MTRKVAKRLAKGLSNPTAVDQKEIKPHHSFTLSIKQTRMMRAREREGMEKLRCVQELSSWHAPFILSWGSSVTVKLPARNCYASPRRRVNAFPSLIRIRVSARNYNASALS